MGADGGIHGAIQEMEEMRPRVGDPEIEVMISRR